MSPAQPISRRNLPAALALGVLLGCSSALAPFEPQVSNAADTFALQATGVRNVSSTMTYRWSNTGTRATINHSTTTQAGTAQITIRDPSGAVVYDKALLPSLNEPTMTGTPGIWSIDVQLRAYSGTLNMRAQKL